MRNILDSHIILNGEIYTEILDSDITDVAPGQFINRFGTIYSPNARYKFRYPVCENNRYTRIKVYKKDGTIYQTSLHRLLMIIFNPTENMNELVVNHINGNKLYNSLMYNLEWTTEAENNRHAFRTGLNNNIGENHHQAKLTEDEVRDICIELQKPREYGTINNLARKYNISDNTILRIAKGKIWPNISKEYNLDYSAKGVESILTESQVIEICEDLSNHKYHGQYTALAKKYNVSPSTIKQIAYRNSWVHISKNYNF